jgi:hypothetical protein
VPAGAVTSLPVLLPGSALDSGQFQAFLVLSGGNATLRYQGTLTFEGAGGDSAFDSQAVGDAIGGQPLIEAPPLIVTPTPRQQVTRVELPDVDPLLVIPPLAILAVSLFVFRLRWRIRRAIWDRLDSDPLRIKALLQAWTRKMVRAVLRQTYETAPQPFIPAARPNDSQGTGITLNSKQEAWEWLGRGQQVAREGDALSARRYLLRALALDPDNDEAWLWLGGVVNSPASAKRCLRRALELNPGSERARLGLADLEAAERQASDGEQLEPVAA